jgi:hypothetical protein
MEHLQMLWYDFNMSSDPVSGSRFSEHGCYAMLLKKLEADPDFQEQGVHNGKIIFSYLGKNLRIVFYKPKQGRLLGKVVAEDEDSVLETTRALRKLSFVVSNKKIFQI